MNFEIEIVTLLHISWKPYYCYWLSDLGYLVEEILGSQCWEIGEVRVYVVAAPDDALCLFGRLDLLGEGREGEHTGLGIDLLI